MSNLKLAVVGALSALTLAACGGNNNNGGASSSTEVSSSSVAVSSEASSSEAVSSSVEISSSSVAVSSEQSSSEDGSSSSEAVVEMATYKVAIVNASASQVLAPAAAFIADSSMPFWRVGYPASESLEMLAEGGSPDDMLAAYSSVYGMKIDGMVPAGMQSEMATFTVEADKTAMLTIAAMPVFTNDAFVGVQNVKISGLAVGESMSINANIYDAGTEKNTESAETVPALGGKVAGFDAARDDVRDQVTMHPGVVSQYELETSALHERYRFDSNSFIVKVYRTENP